MIFILVKGVVGRELRLMTNKQVLLRLFEHVFPLLIMAFIKRLTSSL